jgi:protein TonB
MATLASSRYVPDAEPLFQPSQLRVVGSVPAQEASIARCVYQPSRRSGPVAFAASAGVILAGLAVLATLNVVAEHKPTPRLTVVAVKKLDTTPPPPPKSFEKSLEQQPQAFVPKPMIELPSPGPTQVALDLPPPPSAPLIATARIVAPAGPTVAAAPFASSDPVEGGDLSSQVLYARPPVYPIDARRRREQGTVKLMVLVGPDGRVLDIRLAASSGSQTLDRAALGAVKRWRWSPQKKGGAPLAVRGYVTIPFVLTS